MDDSRLSLMATNAVSCLLDVGMSLHGLTCAATVLLFFTGPPVIIGIINNIFYSLMAYI